MEEDALESEIQKFISKARLIRAHVNRQKGWLQKKLGGIGVDDERILNILDEF